MAKKTAISPTRAENYPEWYQQVIKASELAETSPVRGCMVIRPWGYAIWENIQSILDGQLKATGHRNAYFPLFIPLSYLEKEAAHVDGFATECAVVTHHRLEKDADNHLRPAGPLEEILIVRPTSETIIGEMFSKWIQSHRDLPLLINQWANVVRWEMRPRLFLRTSEFLWQEGHTAHSSAEEAQQETLKILDLYAEFVEQYLAMPVLKGQKTASERFPGADATYCIEAMMQDGKALQAGTSHFLGQRFARAANITYLSKEGEEALAWTTSWGVSTRLIGGLIMIHSDDDGLVLPPRIAPAQVVVLPVFHKDQDRDEILGYCEKLVEALRGVAFDGHFLSVEFDTHEGRAGDKNWAWVKKGIPVRLEIGGREVQKDCVYVGRRDRTSRERYAQDRNEFLASVSAMLMEMQQGLLDRARAQHQQRTHLIDDKEAFYQFFRDGGAYGTGGFAMSHWNGDPAIEEQLKKDLNVTIRCIPMAAIEPGGRCIFSGEPSQSRVVFAKAY